MIIAAVGLVKQLVWSATAPSPPTARLWVGIVSNSLIPIPLSIPHLSECIPISLDVLLCVYPGFPIRLKGNIEAPV